MTPEDKLDHAIAKIYELRGIKRGVPKNRVAEYMVKKELKTDLFNGASPEATY